MLKFTVKKLVVAFGVAGLDADNLESKMKAAKQLVFKCYQLNRKDEKKQTL